MSAVHGSRASDRFVELSELAATMAATIDEQVERAAKLIADGLRAGGKVLACGNGGSAADAQHFVAELLGRMVAERGSLPAVSLACDPSTVTALGNDYGFERVFSRQIEGLGNVGDILVAISTSGRSPNVVQAVETAHRLGLRTIALLGETGGTPLLSSDVSICVPSASSQRVQEIHTALLHSLCEQVEALGVTGREKPGERNDD